MKKIFTIALLAAALTSCENQDQKDEIADANKQKITVDVVAVDNDGTETTSVVASSTLPK